jgi:cell wall-associated NlpC family hydrolase
MRTTFRTADTTSGNGSSRLVRFLATIAIAATAVGGLSVGTGSQPAAAVDETGSARVAASAAAALKGIERGDDVQLNLARHLLAQAVAEQSGADADALETNWIDSGLPREVVVYTGLAQVGVMYRASGEHPDVGFDCSGLTKYAWSATGLTLFHNDSTQIAEASRIDGGVANPGDLVQWPGHIMLYLGVDDVVVHASNSGKPVAIARVGSRKVTWADPLG